MLIKTMNSIVSESFTAIHYPRNRQQTLKESNLHVLFQASPDNELKRNINIHRVVW